MPLVSVIAKRGGGCNLVNVSDGVQIVCAIAPLIEMSQAWYYLQM